MKGSVRDEQRGGQGAANRRSGEMRVERCDREERRGNEPLRLVAAISQVRTKKTGEERDSLRSLEGGARMNEPDRHSSEEQGQGPPVPGAEDAAQAQRHRYDRQ